jgi:hypothetical protein
MAKTIQTHHYDVIVVGGGAAGVAAAIASAQNGAHTLLVEAGPSVGGELLSGLPIDGCLNAQGEWIVGGIAADLFARTRQLDGYVGAIFDWRLIWGVCLDPEVMKLVVVEALARHNVHTLLYSFVEDVVLDGNRVAGIMVVNKNNKTLLTADFIIDCSGDGDVSVLAGAPYEKGSPKGEYQPVTLVFRMSGVDYPALLEFVRDHPEEFILGESPIHKKTPAECAQEIYKSGYPFAGLNAKGPLLSAAIASSEMFPCTAVYMWPTSPARRELGFNTTRIADIDATDTVALSESLSTLVEQVRMAMTFARKNIPGLSQATLSGVAPRIGIRETRRIMGEYVLTADDVVTGRKFPDGIAKGGHHVDIHGSGTAQKRIPVQNGRSYDIPYGCLVPKNISNVLVAGRCLSSTREANGSARVMGQCMATGEAAGTAAAMCVEIGWRDVRQMDVTELRRSLEAQGAVLDGTQ